MGKFFLEIVGEEFTTELTFCTDCWCVDPCTN